MMTDESERELLRPEHKERFFNPEDWYGMTEEEAIDFYYYNVVGAYMGEYTPCFVEVL